MSGPLAFRHADPGDLDAISALIERAYRGDDAKVGWTHEADLLDGTRLAPGEIEAVLVDPACRFLLAHDPELVACALLRREGDAAYFGMFAVDPRRQSGGIGSRVLEAAEDAARRLWSARALRMTVISLREELIAFYERRGYRLTGARERFPFEQTIPRRTDFDFVELSKELRAP